MNTAKQFYDPKQIEADHVARRKRQRRVQYPPMSYWNKYAEMTDEDEFCRAINEVMDKMMKPFLYLVVPAGIIALITYHARLFWLPPVICIGTVVWWVGWGRKRYE